MPKSDSLTIRIDPSIRERLHRLARAMSAGKGDLQIEVNLSVAARTAMVAGLNAMEKRYAPSTGRKG